MCIRTHTKKHDGILPAGEPLNLEGHWHRLPADPELRPGCAFTKATRMPFSNARKAESSFQELHRNGNSPARPSEAKYDVGTAIVFPALNLNLDCLELRDHALFHSDPTYDEGPLFWRCPRAEGPTQLTWTSATRRKALTDRLTE
jgi:hypothetical protein